MGAAFGKIVSSLVNGIFMPLLGAAMGRTDFSEMQATLRNPIVDSEGNVTHPGVFLKYGLFIQSIIEFLIIAICIYIFIIVIVKGTQKKIAEAKLKKELEKNGPAPEVVPEDPADIKLLKEIKEQLVQINEQNARIAELEAKVKQLESKK